MIVIVDLGVGNLFNVLRVFNHVGIQAVITDDIEIIKSADKMDGEIALATRSTPMGHKV